MISGLASTLRACADPGVMEQEGAYLAALQSAAGFEVTSDALFLRNGAGQIVLTYVPKRQTPLEGTSWIADAYNNGRGAVVSVVIGTQITAQFNAGQLSGSGGCNSYSASYSTSGNAIQIGPAASTRVFCGSPEGVMEQEAAYLAALPTAQVYRIEGNRLFLETSGGARVASYMATEPLELVGPEWAWQGTLLNDDTAFIPSDPTRYTLMFTSDGAVGVRADCNSGNGPYTVSGNQISIQILVMTSAFCPPPSLSNDFLQQLGQVATFFISDGQLVLEFPADGGAMRFTPVGGA